MIFPDDKIRVILKEMDLEEKPIRFDDEVFQSTLYESSKKYPQLFNEFRFSTTGTFPYSDLIERVLTRAKISRVLKTVNPDYEFVQLSAGTKNYVDEKIKPKFRAEEYQILKEIGNELNTKLRR
ncbi:Uncharacterised protein [uncultured archaeon]|nr:Uncharacterised protein [uncultured archaeon]